MLIAITFLLDDLHLLLPIHHSAEDDCFKILISTDNHLVYTPDVQDGDAQERTHHHRPTMSITQGVWEKDPVRADDSFRSFEEVLDLAREHKADMVLLGGDLFHDNKPSRTTLVRTMDILSKACLNSNPVHLELMSNPKLTVVGGYGLGCVSRNGLWVWKWPVGVEMA